MKEALEVPGIHSADKVGIYWQQEQPKFDWGYVIPKIKNDRTPRECFVLWAMMYIASVQNKNPRQTLFLAVEVQVSGAQLLAC